MNERLWVLVGPKLLLVGGSFRGTRDEYQKMGMEMSIDTSWMEHFEDDQVGRRASEYMVTFLSTCAWPASCGHFLVPSVPGDASERKEWCYYTHLILRDSFLPNPVAIVQAGAVDIRKQALPWKKAKKIRWSLSMGTGASVLVQLKYVFFFH